MVTLTFTRAEVIELTHRINMSTPAFKGAYGDSHEDYTPIPAAGVMPLYSKLNDVSKVF